MRRLLLSICAITPLCALAQENFHIQGTIVNWKKTDSVYLTYVDGQKITIDSVAAVNGKFELRGTVTQPLIAYIRLQRPVAPGQRRDSRKMYLENGLITVTVKDSMEHATITGAPLNADLEKLDARLTPVKKHIIEIKGKAANTPKEDRQAAAFKALIKEHRELIDSMQNIQARFVRENPGSYLAVATLKTMAGAKINYAEIAPLFGQLDEKVRNTPTGRELAARLKVAKTVKIGSVMPPFSSLDTARNPLNLHDVVKQGKLTLVDFWASWCGPCRAENPNLVKAFNTFHEKGFNIISVSLDDKAANWKKAIIKDGMPWYHVSGLKKWDEPVAELFGISAVPDSFLLDGNGKVIARGLRGQALYDRIASELNK